MESSIAALTNFQIRSFFSADGRPTQEQCDKWLQLSPESLQRQKSFLSKFSRIRTQTMASIKEKDERPCDNVSVHRDTTLSQPLPPGIRPEGEALLGNDAVQYNEYGQQDFSFRDLQDLHFFDAKAGEGALVIKHVTSILQQLVQYYQYLCKLKDFPQEIVTKCGEEISRFEMHVKGVEMELQMQASRIETLQRSTSGCKTLLHSILDFRNTQSNKTLALESRASTQEMEHMTDEMKDIAHETQTETVSMKIITLVTLFFLPGTFISVYYLARRTLMSTDNFQNNDTPNPGPNPSKDLSPLQFYLAASVPLTLITLMIWAVFHWWERRKENPSKLRSYVERRLSKRDL